jgi:NADH:ubiquinone oxidoreductase subunit K
LTVSIPTIVIVIVLGLLGIGIYALLTTRNLIKVIVALQLLVKGAMLALVLAGRQAGQEDLGQSMAITVIIADTIVAVIGMALAVQVRRVLGTLDLSKLSSLKR